VRPGSLPLPSLSHPPTGRPYLSAPSPTSGFPPLPRQPRLHRSFSPASTAPLCLQACLQEALKPRLPPSPINLFRFISIKAPPFIAIKAAGPPSHLRPLLPVVAPSPPFSLYKADPRVLQLPLPTNQAPALSPRSHTRRRLGIPLSRHCRPPARSSSSPVSISSASSRLPSHPAPLV
jgi:hypothetical protein